MINSVLEITEKAVAAVVRAFRAVQNIVLPCRKMKEVSYCLKSMSHYV